jgi:hypothetical protein
MVPTAGNGYGPYCGYGYPGYPAYGYYRAYPTTPSTPAIIAGTPDIEPTLATVPIPAIVSTPAMRTLPLRTPPTVIAIEVAAMLV